MPTRILADARFEHMSTKSIILHLLAWEPSPQISLEVVARTIEPMRAELRRRELRGFDDPFDPIHDPVSPS